mgnify:FL=1
MPRLRLIYSLLSVVLMVFVLLPAYQIGQLSFLSWLLAVVMVGVATGCFLTGLARDGKNFKRLRDEAKSLSHRLAWTTAEGFCLALALLGVLFAINLPHWIGATTVISGGSQKPVCVFLKHLLVLGPWNLSVASVVVLFFPAKLLAVEMFWRQVRRMFA